MKNGGFDIMGIFSGQPAPGAQAPAPAQQQQQQSRSPEPAFAPNTSGDPDPSKQAQPAPSSQQTPLDEFIKLFENDPTKKDEPNPDSPDAPIFNIDPAKLAEETKKINFINPEELQDLASKALGGDTQAFMQVLNGVAQAAYAKSAQFSGMLSERATKTGMERLTKTLPNQVRDVQSRNELEGLNPVFKHPAVQPLVEPLRQQFQQRNPGASSKEIASMVDRYLVGISKELGMQQVPEQTDRRRADESSQDFEDFFGQNW
jgi:hypothetical protein